MKNYCFIISMFVMCMAGILVQADSTPMATRVYGNQYTPGVPDTQLAGIVGQLVPTEVFGTNGSLSLASQVINASAVATQVLSDGIIAVAFATSTNSYLVEYTSAGAVNSSFASGTSNKLTLSNLPNATASLVIDKQNRLLLAGAGNGSLNAWITRVMPEGIIDSSFNFVDGASWGVNGSINRLAIQTSGKIIAAGSNGTNAMLARYELDGSVDTSFGNNGYVILDGSGIYPTVTEALNTLIIDTNNNMYIAYVDATPSVYVIKLNAHGLIDVNWNSGDPVNMSYLDGSAMVTSQLCMILDSVSDLIVAIPSGSPTVIKAASIQASNGSAGTFANFTTSGEIFGSDNYELFNMMATSDGSVYLLGADATTKKMAIIRVTSSGLLDTTFNPSGTPGANFFYPSGAMPSNYARIYAGAIAPSGQIFTAGAQLNSSTTTAYLSSLYNNLYVVPVAQYPQAKEQGTRDAAFGLASTETYVGVVSAYIGSYRNSLQQKDEVVVELASGKILIGQNGYTNSNSYTSMMLIRLTSEGLLDTSFGSGSGKLVLANASPINEFITNILEDGDGNLYVTGYSDNGAIFRKYTSSGILIWNSDYEEADFQGLACAFEGDTRILLFLAGPSNIGQINGYDSVDGSFDVTFHSAGSTPGILESGDFGLDMGPLYSAAIDRTGNIYIAYKNTDSGDINVAALFNSAAGVRWLNEDLFAAFSPIAANGVRVSFNNDGDIAVGAGVDSTFLVSVLDVTTGHPTSFYTTPLEITCGTSVNITQIIGISDNTLMLSGYDSIEKTMLVTRVSATGTLDTRFNSQGEEPGILVIQVSDQTSDYYARVASCITLQSHAGVNQGNIILTGYEQLFENQAMPFILRIFGTPGTTQIKNSPIIDVIPGEFDVSYNGTGIAQTYVLGASTPAANQEVRAIRQLSGTQIMTVITDNTTSISYTQRLNADSSIDTTYGDGLGIAIAKIDGTEVVQSMVFDAAGNFLVTGSNSNAGGFVKKIAPDGSMYQLFGGSQGVSTTLTYPLGTVYGLMDTVNACQQLTNGNIVIVGSLQGVGTVKMLNATGGVVSTFGTTGQVQYGTNITSVSVDQFNNIYAAVAYVDSDTTLKGGIVKLNANGQPDMSFGSAGFVYDAITEIDSATSLRSAFDNSLRVIIAASYGDSDGHVAVNRFTADGLVDTTFNDGQQCEISFAVTTNVFVTSLVVLEDDKILVAGYQLDESDIDNNYEFVACVNAVGVLDAGFGSGMTPGVVTFQALETAQLERKLIDMNIQSDGNILLCGGEIPAVDEETPLTFRLYGFPNVQAVPQFTGYQSGIPNVLNLAFNGTGISEIFEISDLMAVGSVATDNVGHALIGGVTSAGTFVVARFLRNGLLDTIANGGTGFGINGIASTSAPLLDLSGGKVAVTPDNEIYVAGMTAEGQLVVARFDSEGILDTTFGTEGIAASTPIAYLFKGGFLAVDTIGRIVVSGYTSDGNLVATRFLPNGTTDTHFSVAPDYVAYVPVSSLQEGGSVAIDNLNNVYLGGRTLTTLDIAMLDSTGILNTDYGINGIARTDTISGLSDGGEIAIDNVAGAVIGGLTTDQTFVVARFTPDGLLNPEFGTDGITYSLPVDVLNVFGNIAVDSNSNIVVGGTASLYGHTKGMIVARFTADGNLDTTFSSTGMATTEAIEGFVTGGFVVADIFDNVFVGGITNDPAFVVAQMYSGEEIFVNNPTLLNPQDLRAFYYGNQRSYVEKVLDSSYLARVISNQAAKNAVLENINIILDEYALLYSTEPGWNLVWHLYRQLGNFEAARAQLVSTFPNSANEINVCFANIVRRAHGMKYSSSTGA